MGKTIKVACLGDVVGSAGEQIFQKYATRIKQMYGVDVIIVNGENAAANGRGIAPKNLDLLRAAGADMVTGGNHSFQQREMLSVFNERTDVLRPLNFPAACPGKGVGFVVKDGLKLAVINAQGRIYMHQQLDCPFRAIESVLTFVRAQTPIVLIDFHAEASSEKIGLAHFLDGKVSAIVGTHTHVPTADERILPGGTAFVTDLGMAGALSSMIGMKTDIVLTSLLTQMPAKFAVELRGPYVLSGVVIEIEKATGRSVAIERLHIVDDELGAAHA
ncbi:MAG: TIGR00282 family metallophosphoesterase [Candidatus Dependentiae bacterium]|nr:TIGR00282 family metallophosphoesterase [Candidatus Dependentiae bacterium]